jgi:hypothetical protein
MTISKDRSDVVGGILCVQDMLNDCWMTLDFFAVSEDGLATIPGPRSVG